MNSHFLLTCLGYCEVVVCVVALGFIVARRQVREYWALVLYLAVHVISVIGSSILIQMASGKVRSEQKALFAVYFYIYWGAYAVGSIAGIIVLYGVFRKVIGSLKEPQTLAMLAMFAAGVLSSWIFVVRTGSVHSNGLSLMVALMEQLRVTQNVLTLCLLVFVGFAVRYRGLWYRSRAFGVTLGLGVMATVNLALPMFARRVSIGDISQGISLCVAVMVWAVYFAMREPERSDMQLI